MNLFISFKKLPLGLKRTFIAGTIIVPFFILYILDKTILHWWLEDEAAKFILNTIVFGLPIYWILVLIFSWIYVGFKEGEKE